MAKQKLVGKEIESVVALGNGYTLIKFTDGSFIIGKLTDTLTSEELGLGSTEEVEDDEEDEEEDEDEDEEDEDEEEEDEEDEDEEDEEDEEEEDEEDEEEEEDDFTAEDIIAMDFDDLEDVVDDEELDIDVDEYEEDEEGLRKAVAKALDIKLPKGKATKKKGKK